MLLSDVIESRRSIRIYKSIILDEETIKKGIYSALKAPSAHNRQPWRFKILSTSEKNSIADLLESKTRNIPGHTGPHTAGIIRNVPHIVMVFIDNKASESRDMDIISIGACIENMILTYTAMGLGSIWIGNTNLISEEIKEVLKVPYETVSCVGVGYADQCPRARPRMDIGDAMLWKILYRLEDKVFFFWIKKDFYKSFVASLAASE